MLVGRQSIGGHLQADPTLNAPQTRHAIRAHAAGEDGTVWLDMEPNAAGGMHIVVTAVEASRAVTSSGLTPSAAAPAGSS